MMLGPEGRGVRTIIDMVQFNRYYCATSSAGMMRQGLAQAIAALLFAGGDGRSALQRAEVAGQVAHARIARLWVLRQ